ncbi:AraC family ligand binding domain-containing protein [Salipiger profundus]|uniref:AraC family ligand binding domain-containing protein n=1 Tax=Salipiger profundus TaxID=1229727 RepID=UPI0008E8314C|nr:AraC family ligand binding domain-containing protein [Salipiger profundus]SFD88189.1 AraC-like ligand binding domain-containing protein [Salipiger profundus]
MFNKSENREDYQNTRGLLAAMARDLPDGFLIPWHKHRRAQLIYGVTGSITVSTEEGQWVVPPHRAVWIPGDTTHQMRTSGLVQMRTLYVEPEARENLPSFCQVMMVTPLLRELIKEASTMPNNADEEDHSHDAGQTQGPCHIGSPRG